MYFWKLKSFTIIWAFCLHKVKKTKVTFTVKETSIYSSCLFKWISANFSRPDTYSMWIIHVESCGASVRT